MLIAFKFKLALICAAGLAGPLSVAPLLNETAASDDPCATRRPSSNCSPAPCPTGSLAISPAQPNRPRRR